MRWLLVAVVGVAVVAAAMWFKEWLDIDRCLDSGGRYNYDANRCEWSPP